MTVPAWLRRYFDDKVEAPTLLADGVGRVSGAPGALNRETLTRLSRAAIRAQARLPRRGGLTSAPWVLITQGSFSPATPGQAHDGGGAVDLRSRHLALPERAALVAELVREGFGVHDLSQTDAPHFHLLAPWERGMNAAAKRQYATSLRGV